MILDLLSQEVVGLGHDTVLVSDDVQEVILLEVFLQQVPDDLGPVELEAVPRCGVDSLELQVPVASYFLNLGHPLDKYGRIHVCKLDAVLVHGLEHVDLQAQGLRVVRDESDLTERVVADLVQLHVQNVHDGGLQAIGRTEKLGLDRVNDVLLVVGHLAQLSLHLKRGFFLELLTDGLLLPLLCLVELLLDVLELPLGLDELLLDSCVELNGLERQLAGYWTYFAPAR